MRLFFKTAALLIGLSCQVSQTARADDDIEALKREVQTLQQKVQALEQTDTQENDYTFDKLQALDALANRVKFNGFLNVGVSTLDGGGSQSGLNLFGVRDSLAAQANMVVGTQFDVKVNDKLSTSVQFVSRGLEKNDVFTEWAYFNYHLTDRLNVRGGRLRIPMYAYSDAIDVGYAYPWVRTPVEMYNSPTNNFEGFDALYSYELSDYWQGQVQFLYGSVTDADTQITGIDFQLDDCWGTVFSFSDSALTFRFGYHRTHATGFLLSDGPANRLTQALLQAETLAAGLNLLGGPRFDTSFAPDSTDRFVSFTNAAVLYDDSVWFFALELAKLRVDYELYPAGDSGYVSVGRHFGRWMPYATVATIYSDARDDAPVNQRIAGTAEIADYLATLNVADIDPDPFNTITSAEASQGMQDLSEGLKQLRVQQDSVSVGVGYTVTEGLKLKLEASRFSDFGDSQGLFAGGSPGEDAYAYTFIVNSVF